MAIGRFAKSKYPISERALSPSTRKERKCAHRHKDKQPDRESSVVRARRHAHGGTAGAQGQSRIT